MVGFETQDWWFLLLVGGLAIVPAVWLYRDARRLRRNPWPWIVIYAFAALIPRFRFVLMALVMISWWLIRDRELRIWRKSRLWNLFFGTRNKR